ncbi:unnamed protein product [Effrenium voratum]|nr:unnamed protein product [Effrenium voratum]
MATLPAFAQTARLGARDVRLAALRDPRLGSRPARPESGQHLSSHFTRLLAGASFAAAFWKRSRQTARAALRATSKADALNSVKEDGYALEKLKDFQSDLEVVKAAVADSGYALQFASEELKDNAEVVKAAIFEQPQSLEHASARLRGDTEVVRLAVAKDGYALRYASPALQEDLDIVHMALAQQGYALTYVAEKLRADPDIVKLALQKSPRALAYAATSLRADKDMVTFAVERDGIALRHASADLQDDPEIVKLAVAQNGASLDYASERLKKESELKDISERSLRRFYRKASFFFKLLALGQLLLRGRIALSRAWRFLRRKPKESE